ncbi:hypothetical protein PILCRDRAFT_816745, partial [Piloderma croceum F 1598]
SPFGNCLSTDFPRHLVVTYSLLLIHSFWHISCCSVRFPTVVTKALTFGYDDFDSEEERGKQ